MFDVAQLETKTEPGFAIQRYSRLPAELPHPHEFNPDTGPDRHDFRLARGAFGAAAVESGESEVRRVGKQVGSIRAQSRHQRSRTGKYFIGRRSRPAQISSAQVAR